MSGDSTTFAKLLKDRGGQPPFGVASCPERISTLSELGQHFDVRLKAIAE
jgi:hypothetical protein